MLTVFRVREWTVWLYGVFDSVAAIKTNFPGAKMIDGWNDDTFGGSGECFEYFIYEQDLYKVAKCGVNEVLMSFGSPGELIAEFEDACPYE